MQAAAIAAVAGPIVKGIGGYQQGRYNKAVENRNALMAERDASAEALRVQQDVRQHIGGQVASQGASGFQLGAGSFTDALMESQVSGMLDVMNIRRRGKTSADASRAQGKLAGMKGNMALVEGAFGAASALGNMKSDYASGKS